MPHRIACWIYWHAVLLICKGVPLYMPPEPGYQQELSMCPASRGLQHMPGKVPYLWQPAAGWPWR